MAKKTALCFGGTGVAGSSVVRNLKHDDKNDWTIVVVSHQPKPEGLALFEDVEYVQADAFNTGAFRTKLRNYEITHLFYTARVFKPNPRPSMIPAAMAITFLTAPPSSTPIRS